jgi:hypothetical protein
MTRAPLAPRRPNRAAGPTRPPLGYRNVRKPIGGRLVACIEPDPDRGRRDYPPKPLSLGGVAKLLANKAYVGLIDWSGVLVQGQHQHTGLQRTPSNAWRSRRPRALRR